MQSDEIGDKMNGGKESYAESPQFQLSYEYYLTGLDFTDWYRYYFIVQSVIQYRPKRVLEIGIGNRIVEHCLSSLIDEYKTMDLNPNLNPDILGDLRSFRPELEGHFDVVICSEVLEHMPFDDLRSNLNSIHRYLRRGGKAIITLPHRRRSFLFISPSYKHYHFSLPIWTTAAGFYLRFIRKKIIIDPNHQWEIGDLKTKKRDVEAAMKDEGFNINKFMDMLYTDFWVLEKS